MSPFVIWPAESQEEWALYIGAVYRLRVGAPTTETGSEGTTSYAHIHLLARAQLYSHSRLSQIRHCKGASAIRYAELSHMWSSIATVYWHRIHSGER